MKPFPPDSVCPTAKKNDDNNNNNNFSFPVLFRVHKKFPKNYFCPAFLIFFLFPPVYFFFSTAWIVNCFEFLMDAPLFLFDDATTFPCKLFFSRFCRAFFAVASGCPTRSERTSDFPWEPPEDRLPASISEPAECGSFAFDSIPFYISTSFFFFLFLPVRHLSYGWVDVTPSNWHICGNEHPLSYRVV